MNDRQKEFRPSHRSFGMEGVLLSVVLCALTSTPVMAGEMLREIPSAVAGVIVFPNLAQTVDRLNAFLTESRLGAGPLDASAFGVGLNLNSDAWDPASPLVLVLVEPSFRVPSLVVAYRPKNVEALAEQLGGADAAPQRIDGPDGRCYVILRGDTAFCAARKKLLRSFQRHRADRGLFDLLDERERRTLARCDAFAWFSIDRCRDRMGPYLVMATQLVEFGMAMDAANEAGPPPGARVIMRYISDGLRTLLDEMQSTSAAIAFDGTTFRLTHHHRFRPTGAVADYLMAVERPNVDLLFSLPDRPFLLFATANWRCGPGRSLTASMMKCVMNDEQVSTKLSPKVRRRLMQKLAACYGQMQGSSFLLGTPEQSVLPMEIIGTYRLDDSAAGLEQVRYIQEHATEAMMSFVPGVGASGRFESRRCNGLEYEEMTLDLEALDEDLGIELQRIYGKGFRYQHARLGEHEIVYTLGDPKRLNVCAVAKARRTAHRLSQNRTVGRLVERLPQDANVTIVLDAGRLFAFLPQMADLHKTQRPDHGGGRNSKAVSEADAAGATGNQASAKASAAAPAAVQPRLVGWTCVVGSDSLSGEAVMEARDLAVVIRLARDAVHGIRYGRR